MRRSVAHRGELPLGRQREPPAGTRRQHFWGNATRLGSAPRAKLRPICRVRGCARHDSNVRPLPPQGSPAVGPGWRQMAELGSRSRVAALQSAWAACLSREISLALGHVLDILLPRLATATRGTASRPLGPTASRRILTRLVLVASAASSRGSVRPRRRIRGRPRFSRAAPVLGSRHGARRAPGSRRDGRRAR
jgi:hypothetical protein